MATDVVLDACVVVAAVSPAEPHHGDSLQFLQAVHKRRLSLEVPAHFLLELYAVLNRSPRELQQLGFMTEKNPIAIRLETIGEAEVQKILNWVSTKLPGKSPTRGADLSYVWVALDLKQARYNKKRAIRDRNAPNLLVIIRSVGNAITKERGISSEQNI